LNKNGRDVDNRMEEETDENERILNEKREKSYGKKDDQRADIINQERISKHSISDIENFIDNLSETSTGGDEREGDNKIVEPASFESARETEEMLEEDREKTGLHKNSYPIKRRESKGMFLSKSKIAAIIVIVVICGILVFFYLNSIDSDGDGYPDSVDYFPYKDAKVRFSVINSELNDTADYTNETLVYFQVYERLNFNWENQTQDGFGLVEKSSNFYVEDFNNLSNFNITYEVADNIKLHTLTIQVYIYNSTGIDEFLDLDDDETGGLTVDYDIVSGTWTGDDETGVTDGSNDGIAGEKDCYLEYSLTTV
jgi:hypothetical protein